MAKKKSEKSHAILDEDSRYRKAEKIVKTLTAKTGPVKGKLLDIGTGSGHIAGSFAKQTKAKIYSVDLNDERDYKEGYEFKKTASEKLPYDDNFFDYVVTNHVIEHVPDQELHMREIARVLKPGGVAYLATPTKYWLYDPHYTLPFISWLPRRASTSYLKMAKNKTWDIYPISTFALKKLSSKNGLEYNNVTPDIIKHPDQFNLDTFKSIQPITKLIPMFLLRSTEFVLPTTICLLKKK